MLGDMVATNITILSQQKARNQLRLKAQYYLDRFFKMCEILDFHSTTKANNNKIPLIWIHTHAFK